MTYKCGLHPLILIAVLTGAGGCGRGGDDAPAPAVPIEVRDVGFATPESVLHDPVADVYLVSNINGSPFAIDDNGFISRISPAGDVLDLKWIDGSAADVTLNAPKGMAVHAGVLYVTDLTAVRMFDRSTGATLGHVEIEGAAFLNDVAAAGDGSLYVTDSGYREGFEPSGTDAVYRLVDGQVENVGQGDALGHPNGVLVDGADVWVVTFGGNQLFRVVDGSVVGAVSLPQGGLDGLVAGAGRFLVSSWEGAAVYGGPMDGPFSIVVDSVTAPADIGFDVGRNVVLIPLFQSDAVRIVPVN
jgi:hypothetical protein